MSILYDFVINILNLFFYPISDSVAVIILGIITLIVGVLLSSIPWLDYFILKVNMNEKY